MTTTEGTISKREALEAWLIEADKVLAEVEASLALPAQEKAA